MLDIYLVEYALFLRVLFNILPLTYDLVKKKKNTSPLNCQKLQFFIFFIIIIFFTQVGLW